MDRFSCFRMTLCSLLAVLVHLSAPAQKRWDGGAGDGQWSSALNWMPDGVPGPGDDVLLDNSTVPGHYVVSLPPAAATIELTSLAIMPSPGDSITLDIPSGNMAVPAFSFTSTNDALVLGQGAILLNASGATSGETILMQGLFRINNGGRYVHRTTRANAYLIDHLAKDSSTRHGLFEFDVPGNAGYTVSLTGNTFGDLRFSASAAGGAKSYSGSGSASLVVMGHLQVSKGAQLTSTMTADIRVAGDLVVEGTLNLHPVTPGITGRSLLFPGDTAHLRGNGPLNLGTNFRNIDMLVGSTVILQRDLSLPFPSQSAVLHAGATLDLGTAILFGTGGFLSEPGATLRIGDAAGLSLGDSGNLRTGKRQLDPAMTYIYEGDGPQSTGNALPTVVSALEIDKPSGDLTLTQAVEASFLDLRKGLLISTNSTMITIGAGGITAPMDAYGRTDEGWSGSHVKGPCNLRTTGIGIWRFPTGDGDHFAPVALHRTRDGEILYAAEYHHATLPVLTGLQAGLLDSNEYWSISATGSSPQHDAWIDLSWRRNDWPILDSMGTATLNIAGLDSSSGGLLWKIQGMTSSVENFGQVGWARSGDPVSTFTSFTLEAGAALSVLSMTGSLHCQATRNGNALILEGERPDPEVRIEFSSDGAHFNDLAFAPTDGSAFLDDQHTEGTTWYRMAYLREGYPTLYSNTCRVRRDVSAQWKVFPQPATDHVSVNAPYRLSSSRFRIMDLSGRTIKEGVLPEGQEWNIDLGHAITGPHVLQVFHDQGTFSIILVVQ